MTIDKWVLDFDKAYYKKDIEKIYNFLEKTLDN